MAVRWATSPAICPDAGRKVGVTDDVPLSSSLCTLSGPPAATAALSRHWVCLRFTLPAQTASLFPLCFSQGIWERLRCHPCAPTPSPPRKAGRKGPADASVAGNEPRPPKNNKQGLQGVGDRVSRGGVREDEGAPIYRLPSRHAPDSHTPSLLPPVAAALTGSGRHPRF